MVCTRAAACGSEARWTDGGGAAPFFSGTFFHFKDPKGRTQVGKPSGAFRVQGCGLDPQAGAATPAVEGCGGGRETQQPEVKE